MMKKFKLTRISTGEKIFEYFAEEMNAVDGIGHIDPQDIEHREVTQEEIEQEQKEETYATLIATINKLLEETDWTQLLDTNLTADRVELYKLYRAELRSTKGLAKINPYNIVIPNKPE